MEGFFITAIDLIGTFAFAISGIRLAYGKNIDWFGAYVIGLVTPFWMLAGKYFLTTGIALLIALLFKEKIFRLGSTLFLFDAIGLGLFTVGGISKSLEAQLPFWVAIVMGTITGSVGGLIRDVLLNEVPLLLRRNIYALDLCTGLHNWRSGLLFMHKTQPFSKRDRIAGRLGRATGSRGNREV